MTMLHINVFLDYRLHDIHIMMMDALIYLRRGILDATTFLNMLYIGTCRNTTLIVTVRRRIIRSRGIT
jgi:hypothetical protein